MFSISVSPLPGSLLFRCWILRSDPLIFIFFSLKLSFCLTLQVISLSFSSLLIFFHFYHGFNCHGLCSLDTKKSLLLWL